MEGIQSWVPENSMGTPKSWWRRNSTTHFHKEEWMSGGLSFGLGTFNGSWGPWVPELSQEEQPFLLSLGVRTRT